MKAECLELLSEAPASLLICGGKGRLHPWYTYGTIVSIKTVKGAKITKLLASNQYGSGQSKTWRTGRSVNRAL